MSYNESTRVTTLPDGRTVTDLERHSLSSPMPNFNKLTLPITPGHYWWYDNRSDMTWVHTTPAVARITHHNGVFYITSTDHINLELMTFLERYPGAVFSSVILCPPKP